MARITTLIESMDRRRSLPRTLLPMFCSIAVAVSLAGCGGDSPAPVEDPAVETVEDAGSTTGGGVDLPAGPDTTSGDTGSAVPSTSGDTVSTAGDTVELPAAGTAKALALTYMVESDVAALIAHPSRVLASPLLEPFPLDEMKMQVESETGFSPTEIESLAVLMSAPGPNIPEKDDLPTLIVALKSSIAPQEFAERQFQYNKLTFEDVELNGSTYVRVTRTFEDSFGAAPIDGEEVEVAPDDDFPEDEGDDSAGPPMAIVSINPQTLMMSTENKMKTILTAGNVQSPLSQLLSDSKSEADLLVVGTMKDRPDLQQMVSQGAAMATQGPLGESPLAQFSDVPSQVESIVLAVGLNTESLVDLRLISANDEAASSLHESATGGQAMLTGLYNQFKAGPLSQQAPPPVLAMADRLVAGLSVGQDGTAVDIRIANPGGLQEFVDSLRPMLEAAQAAAEQAQQRNQMKMIGLGLHNFYEVYQRLAPMHPTRLSDEDGKLLVSWRVHLLPFVDDVSLHDQFNVEEAWDSDQNKPLAAETPGAFRSKDSKPGTTRFLTFTGENTLYPGGEGLTFRDVTDGLSTTLMFVEVAPDKAMPWTQPTDIPITTEDLTTALGEPGERGYRAIMMDGASITLKSDITDATLRALISPAGGEDIELADYLAQ